MVQFTGDYEQISRENYEEFLKALNVGMILRKATNSSTPVMIFTEEGGNWTRTIKTILKTMEVKFRLGEEFEEHTTDGRKCKTIVVMEGNKLILTQKAMKAGEKDVLDVMEFTEDGLTMTWTTEGATCVQVFNRT